MSKPKRPVSRDSDPAASGKTDSALRTSGRESNDFDMELDEEDTRALREDLARAVQSEDTAVSEIATEPEPAPEPDGEAAPVRKSRRRTEELPSVQRPVDPKLERISRILTWTLLPLIFLGVFYVILKKQPHADQRSFASKPSLPIKGQLVQIASAESGWRPREESDRVSSETQTITKSIVFPAFLPVLKLTVAPETQNGFLRILFFDSEGKIAGDARVVKVVSGQVQATSAGEQITGDHECLIVASTGMQTAHHLTDYFAGDATRWSVEISESNDYQAKGEDWKPLQTFAIANAKF